MALCKHFLRVFFPFQNPFFVYLFSTLVALASCEHVLRVLARFDPGRCRLYHLYLYMYVCVCVCVCVCVI
jgi:hypothetical protein